MHKRLFNLDSLHYERYITSNLISDYIYAYALGTQSVKRLLWHTRILTNKFHVGAKKTLLNEEGHFC